MSSRASELETRRGNAPLQEKPLWPMRSVEPGNEHVRKFSLATRRLLQMQSIGFAQQKKIAFFQELVETLNDWCKRRQREFFEFPSGSFQTIQRAQQQRRRTGN